MDYLSESILAPVIQSIYLGEVSCHLHRVIVSLDLQFHLLTLLHKYLHIQQHISVCTFLFLGLILLLPQRSR
jgi:hypothetical protein